jgi:Mrp family chromosome partitioning ATPase
MNDSKSTDRQGASGGTGPVSGASKLADDKIAASLARIRHKILVMSGKGGVGKSSVSAGLALMLAAAGDPVGLLDVDIHGPSLAGMMGLEGLLDLSADGQVMPKQVDGNLKVVSMQSLMTDADQAVIWRGPAKSGVIRQFIGDVQWGDLTYLVIDAPPGTGDEPLSVAQTIPGAKAVIVTTPQEVALSDVRKSINFCRAIQLELLGIIENMGPFACPCCGKPIALFKSGGGQMTAEQMNVPFFGTLPFDPQVVKACDTGIPRGLSRQGSPFLAAMDVIARKIKETLGP